VPTFTPSVFPEPFLFHLFFSSSAWFSSLPAPPDLHAVCLFPNFLLRNCRYCCHPKIVISRSPYRIILLYVTQIFRPLTIRNQYLFLSLVFCIPRQVPLLNLVVSSQHSLSTGWISIPWSLPLDCLDCRLPRPHEDAGSIAGFCSFRI